MHSSAWHDTVFDTRCKHIHSADMRSCAGRKADPLHTSPLLESEVKLAEYNTLAEFTYGQPRHHVMFTSHRIIVQQRKRFFGLFGKQSEQFICYRCVKQSPSAASSHGLGVQQSLLKSKCTPSSF